MAKKTTRVNTVDSIVDELTEEVRKGLGKKHVSQKAKDFWIVNTRQSVTDQLKNGGDTWDKDRKGALATARKMGKIAAILAGDGIVMAWAAEAAHDAVKNHPLCPVVGGGGYCDF